jgi:hypothetical protein
LLAYAPVLSNYDIDVDLPKPEHTKFLDAQVVQILIGQERKNFFAGLREQYRYSRAQP